MGSGQHRRVGWRLAIGAYTFYRDLPASSSLTSVRTCARFRRFCLVSIFVFRSLVFEILLPVLIRLSKDGCVLVVKDILIHQRFPHNRTNSVLRHPGGVSDTLMFGNIFSFILPVSVDTESAVEAIPPAPRESAAQVNTRF